ncbi:MAG: ABC transporter permease subunit [Clostridiaceae bacterium]
MGRLNEVLYDHIGREYPRLNLYLAQKARLENAIARGGQDKPELVQQRNELIKNRKSNPYIVALENFKIRENEYKKTGIPSKIDLPGEEYDETDKSFNEDLVKAKAAAAFYQDYKDLDYEAKLQFEKAKLEEYHLPRVIKYRRDTIGQIREAQAQALKITPEMIRLGQEKAKTETAAVKATYEKGLAQVNQKRAEGSISKKALANGKRELKAELDSRLKLIAFLDPKRANDELIKAKSYELKLQTKVHSDVMNKDIADLRRKTPVETEKTTPWLSFLSIPVPGLAQLLLKQPVKAALFFIGALFTYIVAIPYALGYGNYMGNGLFGLFTLAEGGTRQQRSVIFMIEGIIALVLLGIGLAVIISSFLDARKTEKGLIRGIRERSWFETKTGIQTDGFPYLVSLPALLMLLFIVIVPLSTTILLSFTNQDPNNQAKFSWVGFDNYVGILQGKGSVGQAFVRILGWTLVWTMVATTSAIVTGFALALLTNNPRIKGKTFFRTIYLLPWAVPAFITIMFFSLMVAPNGAITTLLNQISSFFGGSGDIRIKNSALYTRIALIMLQTWLGSAYIFLLSTGVLQAIPEDLYEAAQIDGASSWQKVSRITMPLVLFQTAPLLVGQYTFNFNNFSVIRLFNGGGPFDPAKYGNLGGSSDLLITYIYNLVMVRNYQAMGAAVTIIVSMALMLFTFIGFRNSKAFREERL